MALISVIVPTYNRAQTLLRALESVINQSHSAWEMVVVDDGSTDDTRERVSRWAADAGVQSRYQYVRTENRGVSAARNLGVQIAQGDWLAFLDSDDEWLPNKLSTQWPLLSEFKWVHGEEIWIRNGVRVNPMKKHAKSGGRIFTRCADLCCVSPSAVILSREIFVEADGFREDFPVCEDYDLWLKISSRHEIGFVPSPILRKYGGHGDQLSRRFVAMDYFRCLSLREQLSNPHISEKERDHVREVLAKKEEILARGFARHGRRLGDLIPREPVQST